MPLVNIPDACPECSGVGFTVTHMATGDGFRMKCTRCNDVLAFGKPFVEMVQ